MSHFLILSDINKIHSITIIMKENPTIILRKGKETPVKRFHPWIFSGAVYKTLGNPSDGEIVTVKDANDNIIATGHYNKGSIVVRIIAFCEQIIDQQFWNGKIQKAWDKRKITNFELHKTNCFRLVHAEGDGLPGLIIDIYHKIAIIQCHSIGMHLDKKKIADAILNISGSPIEFIYDKSKEVLPQYYAKTIENDYIGAPFPSDRIEVLENGHTFYVNWVAGQKTGFFLDQRDNRKLLGSYAQGKTILNTFCYSGGFSIYALGNKAKEVHSIDVSQKAIDWTNKNEELNHPFEGEHQAHAQDVMQFFKTNEQTYDIVIVDPPAFAKNLKKRHNAVQGYKRLNALAFKAVNPGGLMFTFSCSQVVDSVLFQNTIVAAALEAGRKASIIHRLSQPFDHPVSLFHPEGSYLKGLVLYVE